MAEPPPRLDLTVVRAEAGNVFYVTGVGPAMSDFNDKVIAEFRANGGVVEQFGSALVLLHTVGAKSGEQRTNPVASQEDDGRWFVFASAAGADANPAWYHNLQAHPDIDMEVGVDGEVSTLAVHARTLPDDERAPVWARQKELMPGFADYESKTDRQIPVVELTRR